VDNKGGHLLKMIFSPAEPATIQQHQRYQDNATVREKEYIVDKIRTGQAWRVGRELGRSVKRVGCYVNNLKN
jgi:hypothetical protein